MTFHVVQKGILARYEPYGNDIYLLIDNKLRILKKDTDSYRNLINTFETKNWDHNYFSIPKNVQIQITKSCNFRCSFCYANAINSGKPEYYMTKEKLIFIADKLYSCCYSKYM